MSRVLVSVGTISLLSSCTSKTSDYYVWENELDGLEFGRVTEGDTDFTIAIQRWFENDVERELLRTAEALYPPVSVVENAEEKSRARQAPDKVAAGTWWVGSFDGVRTAYAITASAVHYYRDVVLSHQRGGVSATGRRFLKCTLEYRAVVEPRVEYWHDGTLYSNSYVVRMNLLWGAGMSHNFRKQRVVVFDEEGKLLAVVGDGPPQLTMI